MSISPPACAGCGKQLRTMQRRGQDWYCGVCGPQRRAMRGLRPATGSAPRRPGRAAAVRASARDGDGRDPAAIVTGVIAAIDPRCPPGRVAAAVRRAAARAGQRRQLAWALQDQPGLLDRRRRPGTGPVGAAADRRARATPAPAGSSARLPALRPGHRAWHQRIDGRAALPQLRGQVPRPAMLPLRSRPRGRHPRRARPAAVPALPDHRPGQPGNLRRLRPAPRRSASAPRRAAVPGLPRRSDDDLLDLRQPGAVRDLQGHRRAVVPGLPAALGPLRRLRQTRPVRGGTLAEPLCAACTRPDPASGAACPGCGQPGRLHAGRCARCTMQQRLHELLGDEHGQIRPGCRPSTTPSPPPSGPPPSRPG